MKKLEILELCKKMKLVFGINEIPSRKLKKHDRGQNLFQILDSKKNSRL